MQTAYLNFLRFTLAITDLLLINFCFLLCFYVFNKYGSVIDQTFYVENILFSSICWLLSTAVFGLYTIKSVIRPNYMKVATWKSLILYGAFFLSYLLLSEMEFVRFFLASFYIILVLAFILSRLTGDMLRRILNRGLNISDMVTALRKQLRLS